MATTTQFQTRQGLFGARVALDAGEAATVTFLRKVFWESGGVSVSLFPDTDADGTSAGASGELKYEHALHDEGDFWTEDLDSPYTASSDVTEVSEEARVSRVRVTAVNGAGVFEILSPVDCRIEVA